MGSEALLFRWEKIPQFWKSFYKNTLRFFSLEKRTYMECARRKRNDKWYREDQ